MSNDNQSDSEQVAVEGPITVAVAAHEYIIELDSFILRVANKRYPLADGLEFVGGRDANAWTDVSEGDPPMVRRQVLLVKMEHRAHSAIANGKLIACDMQGLKLDVAEQPIAGRRVFVARERLAEFAMEWWMVSIVDAPSPENPAGHYSITEACNAIERSGELVPELKKRLMRAADDGSLPVFWPGTNRRYMHRATPIRSRLPKDVDWSGLNAWLDANAVEVRFRFPDPADGTERPHVSVTPGGARMNSVKPSDLRKSGKQRRNLLDSRIDEAIRVAGSHASSEVFHALKHLALDEKLPFSGVVTEEGLNYTNSKNEQRWLTPDALRARLKRRYGR